MAQERPVSFSNAHDEALAGILVDTGSEDVVILCHGYAANKNGFALPELAAALAAAGKSSLRFDFAGNGESQGSFTFGGYWREVEDLRAAVGFVRQKLGRSVGTILGHSKGGNVVLMYGSKYDDVPLIVNIAGRGIMSRGVKERFGADILDRLAREGPVEQRVKVDGGRVISYMLTLQAVEERQALDMLALAAQIATGRVVTLHGTADTVIPVEDAHCLAARIPRHTLHLVEGADHSFRQPEARARLVELVVGAVAAAAGDGDGDGGVAEGKK